MLGVAVIRVIYRFIQVAFTRYGDKSRRQRRPIVKALGPAAIPNHHPALLEIEPMHCSNDSWTSRGTMRVISRGAYIHAVDIDFVAVTDRYWLPGTRAVGTLTLLVVYGYLVVQLER